MYDYRDYRDYRDYLDCRDYRTAMPGSLTGIERVNGGALPFLTDNFRVSTKITENNVSCSNALPGKFATKAIRISVLHSQGQCVSRGSRNVCCAEQGGI